jgi:hypothetical protein
MDVSQLRVLYGRAKYTLRDEGLFYFMSLVARRIKASIVDYHVYYIYEKDLVSDAGIEFRPRVEDVSLQIVRNLEQYEELVWSGYSFDSMVSTQLLSAGGIAFCAFVGRELGHVIWVATNETSKRMVDPVPYRVDFNRGEVCSGSSRTARKYRRQGLFLYTCSGMFRMLREEGKVIDRFTIDKNNEVSQTAMAQFHPRVAKLRRLRVLGWTSVSQEPLRVRLES